jgi:hypothetical protein
MEKFHNKEEKIIDEGGEKIAEEHKDYVVKGQENLLEDKNTNWRTKKWEDLTQEQKGELTRKRNYLKRVRSK